MANRVHHRTNFAPPFQWAISRPIVCVCLSLAAALLVNGELQAQLINSSTPQQRIGGSFYEQNGVRWSLNGPGFSANSGAAVAPPFGNPAPNAGLNTGFGFRGGGVSGSLGFNFAQGSSRSIQSTTPSVTTMNGAPGSISSQTIRPFVTGITPVVGGNAYGSPVTENVGSQMFQSQQQKQAAEFRQRANASARARQSKAQEAFERGIRAEEAGDLRKARANYRRALSSDQGLLRQQILMRMHARGWK